MNLGKKTKTIRARFPLLNAIVLVIALILNAIAVLTALLDNFVFLGIPTKYVLPLITLGVGYAVFVGAVAYVQGDEIEIFEKGIKIKDFESNFEDLIIRHNRVLEKIIFDNGKEKAVFKGYIDKSDYKALRLL